MRTLAAFVAVIALLSAAPALAATLHFSAKLDGASETPPTTSTGTGDAKVTVDTVKHRITWTLTYSGLTGPAVAAHFHGPAAVGAAGPVAIPMVPPLTSPIKGSAAITDAQIGDLSGGMWYVNVHTAANKGGEIRGQLTQAH